MYYIWEKAEGNLHEISETALLQSALHILLWKLQDVTDLNFSKEHAGKSEQIAWNGYEGAIIEGA